MSDGSAEAGRFGVIIVISWINRDVGMTQLKGAQGFKRFLYQHMVAERKQKQKKPLALKVLLTP